MGRSMAKAAAAHVHYTIRCVGGVVNCLVVTSLARTRSLAEIVTIGIVRRCLLGREAEATTQLDWPWKITATIRRPCYGPSCARDLKVLAGNCLPFAACTAFSSTFKPRPGPSGSAMYPSTGRSTFGHRRWPSSSNGRKYSVMMKFGIHAEAWTVAESAMVVEL